MSDSSLAGHGVTDAPLSGVEDGAFFLFAGPCVLEGDDLNLTVAAGVGAAGRELGIPVVFKASFDKANRSRLSSARGPGMSRGLAQLARVRDETGLPILTDIHEPAQAAPAAEVADVLQIPAFLCRQTALLVAAGETGRAVNLKKGQWMSADAMAGAVEKVRAGGAGQVFVTERGTSFGYGDLVVDMRNFSRLRRAAGTPVVFDGTHSVQRPAGLADGSTGGAPEHIGALVRGAVAAGCDGLFLEVHPDPPSAPSDATSMLPLDGLIPLLREVAAIRSALTGAGAP